MGYSFFLKLIFLKKSIIFNIENMSDLVTFQFEDIDRDGETGTQAIFTLRQFMDYLNGFHVNPLPVWSRMTATVTTPNGTTAEFVLTSSDEDMAAYYQMCENIATVIYGSENPYTDFLRFLHGMDDILG